MSEAISAINEVGEKYEAVIIKAEVGVRIELDQPPWLRVILRLLSGEVVKYSAAVGDQSFSPGFYALLDIPSHCIRAVISGINNNDNPCKQLVGQPIGVILGQDSPRVIEGFFPAGQTSTEPTPD